MIIEKVFDNEKTNVSHETILGDDGEITQLGAYDNQILHSSDQYASYSKTCISAYKYYVLSKELLRYNPEWLGKDSINEVILGYAPNGVIQSVIYNPFIKATVYDGNKKDFPLIARIPHDNDFLSIDKDLNSNVRVFRVIEDEVTNTIEKVIANIDITYDNNLIKDPKLRNYPYRYFTISDGFNSPLIIQPQWLQNKNSFQLRVKTTVSESSNYLLYVYGYKGDVNGTTEGLNNTASFELPSFSSAYSTFMATSKASYFNNMEYKYKNGELGITRTRETTKLDNTSTIINGVNNAMGSLMQGNIFGALNGGVNSGMGLVKNNNNLGFDNKQYDLNRQQIESDNLAYLKDLQSTPRGVTGTPNDFKANFGKQGKIIIREYRCQDTYFNRIGNYFKRFGYALKDYKSGTLAQLVGTRKNFNYIKFGNCNITGDKIPKDDLIKLKNAFEKGITVWHVERGTIPLNYNYDNEVL